MSCDVFTQWSTTQGTNEEGNIVLLATMRCGYLQRGKAQLSFTAAAARYFGELDEERVELGRGEGGRWRLGDQ